jgi:hypothetical protein
MWMLSTLPLHLKIWHVPLVHPKVYVGADCLSDWIGPGSLNVNFYLAGNCHPVIPHKSNSKLMFPFCSACADTMKRNSSSH